MKLKHFLLTALLLFAGVSGVYAGRLYVGFSSSAYNNSQLQNALDAAQEYDTVFVAAGLYVAGATEFTVKPNVTLIGGYEKGDNTATTRRYPGQFVPFTTADLSATTEFTILDGNSLNRTLPSEKHRVVTVNAGGVVDGCLIRNGHVRNKNGGGVFLNGGKLYNSIVRGNVAMNHPDSAEALGGGVFIQANGELINCLVAYNMANDGYGVAAGQGGGKMINNTITANTYSPVFAKISGGTFQVYRGNLLPDYRSPDVCLGDTLPKWPHLITLTEFYISRIQTTQGQFAVFCAAMDLQGGTQLTAESVTNLPNPFGGGTVSARYGVSSTGMVNVLQSTPNENTPGLKYDDGVWHPAVDTATVEYPMGNTCWFGGLAYSVWLGGGLPTWAQWQFAARREPNGTVNDNLFSGAYGATEAKDTVTWRILDTIAWVPASLSIDTTAGDHFGQLGATWTTRPHEVARKRPNAMGIYDMAGNVNEWCGDSYIARTSALYTASATNPIYNSGSNRIYTGGGYDGAAGYQFSLLYYANIAPFSLNSYGFRPVVAF